MELEKSFLHLLKEEFLKRKAKNPSYSLRAYSKQIGVDQSLLSKWFRGKRNPSPETAQEVAQLLGLPVKFRVNARSKRSFKYAFNKLEEEHREFFTQWYHFAILQYLLLGNVDKTEQGVAKALKISRLEAKMALEDLIKSGFIEKKDQHNYKTVKSNNLLSDVNKTTKTRKRIQKQIISRAVESIDAVPYEKRHSSSLTINLAEEEIAKLKQMVSDFRAEVSNYISECTKDADQVYQFNFNFFPLTDEKVGEKK